ncbi:MAG: glycosyltransferase, partial [Pseudomonadota bacterium]
KKKDSKIKILMATRLLRAKGIYDFVNAAKAIKPKFSHVNFYLAGEPDSGNPSSIDSKEFHQWKNDDYIEILGHVNSVENLLAKMDIVALPSQYGEGVPRILVEAAACGLPLVATDVPGCREIVFDGKTGLLVPPGDLSSLIDALEKLIKDAEFRRTCGEQSRLHCEENYSSNVVNNKTMQVYESLNMNRS